MHKGKKYTEPIREFILTLRIYGPRAYEYVREKFNRNLPHASTICKWYQQSNIQSRSGICEQSMQILKDKVEELRAQNKELFCGIIHDEMAIRQHVQWLDDKIEFAGFITFGKVQEDAESLPLATQALVFLVTGIIERFHLPIAYYFINELENIDKCILMSSVIEELTIIGVKTISSTFDGHPTNITACEILGCNFDLDNFHPQFKNPSDSTSLIYTFFDPPHMLKLTRNHLSAQKVFYDRSKRAIEWKYFELLVDIKHEEN